MLGQAAGLQCGPTGPVGLVGLGLELMFSLQSIFLCVVNILLFFYYSFNFC